MADFDDIKQEVEDISNYMNELAFEAGEKIVEGFERGINRANDINRQLEKIVKNAKKTGDLPKHIKNAADLQAEMFKSSELFETVQKRIFQLRSKEIKEYWEKAEQKLLKQLSTMHDTEAMIHLQVRVRGQIKRLIEDETELLKEQLDLLKEQVDETSDLEKIWEGIKDLGKSLIIGFFRKVDEGFAALVEGPKEFGNFMSKMVEDLLAAIPIIGGPLKSAFVLIKKSFLEIWNYIDERVLPANQKLISQIGVMGKELAAMRKQVVGVGDRFEALGLGFEQGQQMVVGFAKGLKTVEPLDPMALKSAENLVAVLGMGADEAGKFALQIQKQTGSLAALKDAMIAGAKQADKFGVPISEVQRDMAGAPDILARFTVANRRAFAEATAKAQSYGLTIKDVNSAFGNQLDSFEGSAEAAAKLNTIFGTNINSMELMMEADLTKRMEMLRSSLIDQGHEWENLNVYQQNAISQALKMDKAQLALVLSSDKERKSLEAKMKRKQSDAKINEAWERGVTKIRKVLINLDEEFKRTLRSISNLVARFFGFESGIESITDTTKLLHKVFDIIRTSIDDFAAGIDPAEDNVANFKGGLEDIMVTLKDVKSLVSDAKGFIDAFALAMDELGSRLKQMTNWKNMFTGGLYGIFSESEHEKADRLAKELDRLGGSKFFSPQQLERIKEIKKELQETEGTHESFDMLLKRAYPKETADRIRNVMSGGTMTQQKMVDDHLKKQKELTRLYERQQKFLGKRGKKGEDFGKAAALLPDIERLEAQLEDSGGKIVRLTEQIKKLPNSAEIVKLNTQQAKALEQIALNVAFGQPAVEKPGSKKDSEQIIKVELNMDGKKITEAQIVAARQGA